VESQVNSWVNFAVMQAGKLRNIAVPARWVVADKVAAMAGQAVRSGNLGVRIRAAKLHLDNRNAGCGFGRIRQSQCGFGGSEKQPVSIPARQELHPALALALIWLKTHWQPAERGSNLRWAAQSCIGRMGRARDIAPG